MTQAQAQTTKPTRKTASKGADKPTKQPKGKALQKIVDNQSVAEIQQTMIVTAVQTRITRLQEKQAQAPAFKIAVEWARISKAVQDPSFKNSLALLNGALDIEGLAKVIPVHEGRGVGYVQAKTVEKVVRMVHAFALRDLSKLDDYQSQVIVNALFNGDSLSMRAAQASLSRRVECEGMKETMKSRAGYTVGTASSQASQVREVLRLLGIAQVNKGKKDDTMIINEARADILREVFAMSEGE